jgi:CheY-like chemotaxis protein
MTEQNAKCQSILVVEDDESIRETLRFAIAMEGYSVATASQGREALNVLAKMKEPCLILLDLMMPVMNGWEFVLELQKDMTLSMNPIVIVTAFAENADGIIAEDVIKKPVDLNRLFAVIYKYCRKESGENPPCDLVMIE